MNEGVYPKDSEHAQRAEGENRVVINYAQESALHNALAEQMRQCRLTGLQKTLISAIFRQTVGYRKRVEDFNGKRLENISGSRYDYCRQSLNTLIAQSIVIAESGYYGQILALNYDFSQWGKTPAENQSNGKLISEPEALLETLTIREDSFEMLESPEIISTDNVDKTEIRGLHAAIQALKNEVSTLKTLLQDVLPSLPHASNGEEKIAESGVDESAEETVSAPLATLEHCSMRSHAEHENENTIAVVSPEKTALGEVLSNVIRQIPNETKAATPIPSEAATPIPSESAASIPSESATPIPNEIAPPMTHETTTIITPNNSVNAKKAAYTFPSELKPHEQKTIAKLIDEAEFEDQSTPQLLLDDLRARYEISDWQPIRSPIAYFRSLIKRFLENNFVSDYVEAYRERCKEDAEKAEKAEKEQHIAQQKIQQRKDKAEYQEACYQYRQAAFLASFDGCSLRDMAKQKCWESLLERLGFNLDVAPEVVLQP